MKRKRKMFTGLALIFLTLSVAEAEAAVVFYGPTPYRSFNDSPFNGLSLGQFYLETFEDGSLNTPGVTVINNKPGGSSLAAKGPGVYRDSVDADDGRIDGLGQNGYSLAPSSNDGGDGYGFTFSFNSSILGRLPTHVGIVWTDGSISAPTLFEAFDSQGQSLGTIGPVDISDNSWAGTTGEDRFFGAAYDGGISKFVIRDPGGTSSLEVDHLQYGSPVPIPGAVWLLGSGVAGFAVLRKRKDK